MAKTQRLVIDAQGMATNAGDLSKAPGALTVVENFDFSATGFLARRRGFNRTTPAGSSLALAYNVFNIFSTPLWNEGLGLVLHCSGIGGAAADRLFMAVNGSTAGGAPIQRNPPGSSSFGCTQTVRSRAFTYNKNSFLVGTPMPLRLESNWTDASALTWAGMPRPPGISWLQQRNAELELGTAAAPNYWLAVNQAVAYRCTFVTKDNEGVERQSAPSGRYVVANLTEYGGDGTSPAAPVTRWQLPWLSNTNGLPTTSGSSWTGRYLKFRLYRSVAVDLTAEMPDDELQLVYEAEVTEAQISAGHIDVTDYAPFLGDYLYTNSISGGDVSSGLVIAAGAGVGLAAENDRPPACTDAAMYAGCAFYAAPKTLRRVSAALLGVGGTFFDAGYGVTVMTNGGVTQVFTAVAGTPAVPVAGSGFTEFHIVTSGPSFAWCIRRTVENLCAAINYRQQLDKSISCVATYIGADALDGMGKFFLECLRQEDTALEFHGDVDESWTPNRNGMQLVGTQEETLNGLCISKPNLPDCVPPANYTAVGNSDNEVLRVVPTSEALFIFMRRGVWMCRGTGPSNFVFDALDTQFRLWSREGVAVMGDYVYAWGTTGIYRLSVAGGVEKIDAAISNYVQAVFQETNSTSRVLATNGNFTLAQPHFNRVLFWYCRYDTADDKDAGAPNEALVLHVDTGAWTRYVNPTPAGGPAQCWYAGCVRLVDGATFLAPRIPWNGGGTVYLGCQRNVMNYVCSDVNQANGATIAAPFKMTWATNVPNPGGLSQWTDFEFFSQPGLWNFSYSLPDGNAPAPGNQVLATVTSDLGMSTQQTITQLTGDKGRMLLATQSGYGTRQTVQLESVAGDANFYSFTGFSFLTRPLGGLNTR